MAVPGKAIGLVLCGMLAGSLGVYLVALDGPTAPEEPAKIAAPVGVNNPPVPVTKPVLSSQPPAPVSQTQSSSQSQAAPVTKTLPLAQSGEPEATPRYREPPPMPRHYVSSPLARPNSGNSPGNVKYPAAAPPGWKWKRANGAMKLVKSDDK